MRRALTAGARIRIIHARAHAPVSSTARARRTVVGAMRADASAPATAPAFRFGLLADIQYCDREDRQNITGTQMRRYRNSLRVASRAVAHFNARGCDFCVHNGDITDHQCAFDFAADDFIPVERGREDLGSVMQILSESSCARWVFTIGNHELYNFTREELRRGVTAPGATLEFKCANDRGEFYYSFVPGPGWRVMVLDPYEVSIYRKGRQQGLCEDAVELLRRHNPNVDLYVSENPDVIETERMSGTFPYFKDLEGLNGRWVPFNGGLGERQLAWARETIHAAAAAGEKVLILSHLLVHPNSTAKRSGKTLMWDYDALLDIIESEEARGCVKCVISGHQHEGTVYQCDKTGTHYIGMESPMLAMDSSPGPFAVVEVFQDEIVFEGYGRNEESAMFPFDSSSPPTEPMTCRLPLR